MEVVVATEVVEAATEAVMAEVKTMPNSKPFYLKKQTKKKPKKDVELLI
jgi:hypothetical protein